MDVECQDCGHTFETRKGLDERKSPLRCGNCKSRKVEPVRDSSEMAEPEPTYVEVFRRYKEGDTPLDVVLAGICKPEQALELREQYVQLAEDEYLLISNDELESKLDDEYEAGQRNVLRHLDNEYAGGYDVKAVARDLGIDY